jgi:hypothetical protein
MMVSKMFPSSVIFLGKDSSGLNNGFPDDVSSPPRMEDYKLGKTSSPRRHNKQNDESVNILSLPVTCVFVNLQR